MNSPSFFAHLRSIVILPFTVTVIVPWLLIDLAHQWQVPLWLALAVGLPLSLAGMALLAWTIHLFIKIGKGTLAPWEPTQQLVVTGPYRHCRNPMITGVLFILVGEALVFRSTPVLYWAGAFVVINTIYFILKEEPDLYRRFGDDYTHYKKHVPRWIPKRKPYFKT